MLFVKTHFYVEGLLAGQKTPTYRYIFTLENRISSKIQLFSYLEASKNNRFYFIDKNGYESGALKRWEKAEQFDTDSILGHEYSWDETFLNDIADLEAAGITHPDFAKVRALFEK